MGQVSNIGPSWPSCSPYPTGPNMGPIPYPNYVVFSNPKKNIPNLEVGILKEKVLHFQF
jgi:hypothetical protein